MRTATSRSRGVRVAAPPIGGVGVHVEAQSAADGVGLLDPPTAPAREEVAGVERVDPRVVEPAERDEAPGRAGVRRASGRRRQRGRVGGGAIVGKRRPGVALRLGQLTSDEPSPVRLDGRTVQPVDQLADLVDGQRRRQRGRDDVVQELARPPARRLHHRDQLRQERPRSDDIPSPAGDVECQPGEADLHSGHVGEIGRHLCGTGKIAAPRGAAPRGTRRGSPIACSSAGSRDRAPGPVRWPRWPRVRLPFCMNSRARPW